MLDTLETTSLSHQARLWYAQTALPALTPVFQQAPGLYYTLAYRLKNGAIQSPPRHGLFDAMDKPKTPIISGHTYFNFLANQAVLEETATPWIEPIAEKVKEKIGLVFFNVHIAPWRRNDPRGARTLLHFTMDTFYTIETANDTELDKLVNQTL